MPLVAIAPADFSEWDSVLNQISESLAESLQSAHAAKTPDMTDESFVPSFSASALDEIDRQLRGFDERLDGIRGLARRIETTLAEDEAAVLEFRRSAATARARPTPAARL